MLSTLQLLKTQHKEKIGSWGQLLNQSRPEWPMLFSFFVIQFVVTWSEMQIVLLFGELLNAVTNALVAEWWRIMRLIVALQTFKVAAFSTIFYLSSVTGLNVYLRTQNQLYAAMLAREQAFFDNAESGDLVSRLTKDTEAIMWAGDVLIYGFSCTVGLGIAISEMIRIVSIFSYCIAHLCIES